MQEMRNRFAICIRRGKSVLGESYAELRECAEHTFVSAEKDRQEMKYGLYSIVP